MARNDPLKFDLLSPQEISWKASDAGFNKAHLSFLKTFLLAILAGAYIAFGAVFSSVAVTGMDGIWPYGFIKVFAGLTFSVGLILVVIGGAELFTGNNLMVMAWINRRISGWLMLRNWLIVYIGNFIGSLLIAFLVLLSGIHNSPGGGLGKVMLSSANGKLHYGFLQAVILGMLCNILVCLAVWLAFSSRTTGGKILSIIFPITAFIAAGFEHSVANMYIIPVGLLIKQFYPSFVAGLGLDLSSLSWANFLLKNLLPVTIGNILGGGGFVGAMYAVIFPASRKSED